MESEETRKETIQAWARHDERVADEARSVKRRIYIATSWKNAEVVRKIAALLRFKGHQVFDFTDPENRPKGLDSFVFSAAYLTGNKISEIEWKDFLDWPETKRAFKADKAGLDWANTVLMLLPCGRNAHLEAGYGVGRGKSLFIYGSLPRGEYEAMYGFAEACYRTQDFALLIDRLSVTKLQAELEEALEGDPASDRSDRPI